METTNFVNPAGRLLRIDGGPDCAFVPDPLPDQWAPSQSLVRLWVEARDIVGELSGTGRAMHDYALLIRPLRQREALRSSSLEGTYATPTELLAYEMDPRDPHSPFDPANTWREVFNYQKALEHGQYLVESGYPFSEWFIRQLHQTLLVGVRGDDKSPGNIRTNQVHIGAGHRFTPPPPEILRDLMGLLEKEMQADNGIDPLVWSFMVHYQFETIHPFRDGNGRVGRLLLALMIYKHCGFDLPWLYLSEFFEKHRDEYINSLYMVSAAADWERWIRFCFLATIETSKNTIRRIKKLLKLKSTYEEKIRGLSGRDRLVHLLPRLMSAPILTYKDLMDAIGVSYPTARGDMDALIDAGIVKEMGSHKNPKIYYAHEIMTVAYYDDEVEDPPGNG